MNTATVKSYSPPPLNIREICRYAGCKNDDAALFELIGECLEEAERLLTYKVCYTVLPLEIQGDKLNLGFTATESNGLKKCLDGCSSVLAFSATVGIGADRLIKKYSKISPAKALIMDALCTERIESVCDAFCADIRREYANLSCSVTPRFSPGYGDLSLSIQPDILSATDALKNIGITLSDSLLMIPTKSVTAIIGIKPL